MYRYYCLFYLCYIIILMFSAIVISHCVFVLCLSLLTGTGYASPDSSNSACGRNNYNPLDR